MRVTVTAGGKSHLVPLPLQHHQLRSPPQTLAILGRAQFLKSNSALALTVVEGPASDPQIEVISFNRQSSESIDTIAEFICEALVNLCRADDKARSVCASARSAASSARNGTGAQADMFNDQFGIPTKFADVTSLDENGNPIPGTGLDRDRTESASLSASSATTNPTPSGTSLAASVTSAPATGFGDFGSCSTPAIQFGTGFDGRRETSFQPADRSSYNQASSRDVGTVARAICNALSGSCRADQTAINNCNTASSAASAAASNTGAQADAFNAAFGLSTNFAAIQPVNDADSGNGNNGGGGASATSTTRTTPTPSPTSTRTTPTPTPTPTPPSNNGGNGNNGNNNDDGNLQTFNGSLGGIRAPSVTDAGNGRFQVQGNTFNNLNDALRRSCDIQVNECSNAANASNNQGDFTVQNSEEESQIVTPPILYS
ncbi:hypothetical protein ONZ45_g18929 [Pleurotus djamor]|nr:hypothetical protein ONZ45_g18929 [Pleurotus djamor]